MTAESSQGVTSLATSSQQQPIDRAVTGKTIPPHISEVAQDYYRVEQPADIVVDINTAEGAAALRAALHPLWVSSCNDINHPYSLDDETIGGIPGVWVTTPNTGENPAVLLCLHGGAFVLGTPKANAASAISIAHAAGLKIFSADYRLAPEHPYPAAIEDAISAFNGLQKLGYSAEHIGVIGESAGGGLALAMSLILRDAGEALPGAIYLSSVWADLSRNSDSVTTMADADPDFADPEILYSCVKPYARDNDLADPLISPVHADLSGFPPLLIQAGSREILLSDSLRVARNARVAGVNVTLDVWDGMWHVFNAHPKIPEAQQANREIGAFFRQHLMENSDD